MKTKTSLIATAATIALFGAANGQTVVDITGSTAGRTAVHNAIIALLDDAPSANPIKYAWFDDSNPLATSGAKAKYVIYKGSYDPDGEGTGVAAKSYIVRTYWSGSALGVRDTAEQNELATFLDVGTTTVTGGGTILVSPVFATAGPATTPEIGFSDVFQTSTDVTTGLLVEDEVGVIPFKFFKHQGAAAGLTNVTPGLFRALYGSTGSVPLSLFTGLSTDSDKFVFSTGRNSDSGTRITTAAETGLGVFGGMNQWTHVTLSGEDATVEFVGNLGYSSGGDVAGLLSATNITGFDTDAEDGVNYDNSPSLIGYVGSSDWSKVLGGTELAYNGVTLGALPANKDKIAEGLYSFWGFLHQSRMTLEGDQLGFYDLLKTQITNFASTELVKIGDMKVTRDSDGGPIYTTRY